MHHGKGVVVICITPTESSEFLATFLKSLSIEFSCWCYLLPEEHFISATVTSFHPAYTRESV